MVATQSKWYVARTQPLRERWAAENISRAGAIVYHPQILDTTKARPGAHKLKFARLTSLFPSYLFVQIADARWTFLMRTFGVLSVVMTAGSPAIVRQSVIDSLKSREDANGIIGLPPAGPARMRVGTQVRVLSGAFTGSMGLVEKMAPHERVHILLDLLGRRVSALIEETALEAA